MPAERHRDSVDSETFKYVATSRLSSSGDTTSASDLSLMRLLRCPGRGRGRTLPRRAAVLFQPLDLGIVGVEQVPVDRVRAARRPFLFNCDAGAIRENHGRPCTIRL